MTERPFIPRPPGEPAWWARPATAEEYAAIERERRVARAVAKAGDQVKVHYTGWLTDAKRAHPRATLRKLLAHRIGLTGLLMLMALVAIAVGAVLIIGGILVLATS